MALPALVNGMLPTGIHVATLQDIWATFDQGTSSTRAALNLALSHAVMLIWARDATAMIYVNGSYVTDTIDPVDVDLAVRSDFWDDTTFVAAFSRVHPGEERLVDVYFNTTSSSQHMKICFKMCRGVQRARGSYSSPTEEPA